MLITDKLKMDVSEGRTEDILCSFYLL